MADAKPTFMQPNNLDSIGSASVPDPSKPGMQKPMDSQPEPNTKAMGKGDVPGSSPNKAAPSFMGPRE